MCLVDLAFNTACISSFKQHARLLRICTSCLRTMWGTQQLRAWRIPEMPGQEGGSLPFSAAGQSGPILGPADVSASHWPAVSLHDKSFGQVSRGSTWSNDGVCLSFFGDLAIPRWSIYEKGLGGLSIPYVRLAWCNNTKNRFPNS